MENLLVFERIKEWAEGKGAGDVIGVACSQGCCPLANYLHEQTGRKWHVGTFMSQANGGYRLVQPEWVKRLIDKIDDLAGGDEDDTTVTREEFLQCLNEVRP